MENHLFYRWPVQSGKRPLPTLPAQIPVKRQGMGRGGLILTLCVVLAVTLLAGTVLVTVALLMNWGAVGVTAPTAPSSGSSSGAQLSDWTQEDLPWGEPDPGVTMTLAPANTQTMTANAIYEQTLPSVVYVIAETERGFNAGTGVVVTRSGYMISNYHIIDKSVDIQVMLLTDQSRYYDAQVIGFDEEYDLAVLKFEAEGLVPAILGDSDRLAVGDLVYAIGNPMGYLYGSMTEGIVSALDRENVMDGGGMGMIQVSAPLNQGNSGGALVDAHGQVVGMTSAKITGVEEDTVIEGLGLAIPTSDLLPFVNRILATGASWRPSMGVTCWATTQQGRAGIQIQSVEKNGPAAEGGLRSQDFIISANGQPVPTVTALRRLLYRVGVGGVLTCTVWRDGEELELSLSLADAWKE